MESLTSMFALIADRRRACHTIHLLQALPLIHFLREESIPNETRLLTLKEAVYHDPFLHFTAIHKTMDFDISGYEECNSHCSKCVLHVDLQYNKLIVKSPVTFNIGIGKGI